MAFVAPPGYQPIYNPAIPYIGPLYGGLRTGMNIYIQGKIEHHNSSFHVNLQCGDFDGCDIAFHFNPRFDLWDKVVLNTFQNGEWEEEVKVHEMPFHKGHHFEMVILVNSEGYQVNVNGREFYFYQHRMPLERVSALKIGGNVCIETINIFGGTQGMEGGWPGGMAGSMGGCYPGGGMGGGYPGSGMGQGGYPGSGMDGTGGGFPGPGFGGMGLQPIFNPAIPYSDMIPGGMISRRTIIIRGMVPFGAERFSINFLVGASRDIAFHISCRMSEGVIVRNSQIGGLWGEEEIDFNFNPFLEGQFFEVSIQCGDEKFSVYANGQPLFSFFHRFQPYNQIDMLEVDGDVQLSYIHY